MGNSTIKLDRTIIHGADEKVMRFIDEWMDETDCVLAHTSGSTGTPKPIRLLKQDMLQSARATCEFFGINETSTMVMPLSVDYIAGKMMIVRAMVSGAILWIEAPSNSPLIQNYGDIDLLPVVPSQILSIIDKSNNRQIKNLIVGGGAIPANVETKLIASGINAYSTYGMTETCSHVALRKIAHEQDLYEALPGIRFSTDDRDCLIVNAPYFSFKKLQTNDIVELVDDAHFKWVGRYDNVINTAGIKVFPEEIEAVLSTIIDAPFYIIGTPDDKWGEAVTLYIEGKMVDVDNIEKQTRCLLDRYRVPKKIICVDRFERTESGKIKRVRLF